MMADARQLSYPRFPGSDGDKRAIDWLATRFRDLGLETERHGFTYDMAPAWAALRILMIGAAILIAGAGWLAGSAPLSASVLVFIALAAGGFFLSWAPGLERLYRRPGPTRTANVVARRPAKARPVPGATLVLMAHHDSKSQNLTLPTRAGLTLLGLAGGLALAVTLIQSLASGVPPQPAWLAPVTGTTAALALFVLSTLASGNLSPGAVDNAGSVAIVLELARTLPREVSQDVELIFLSPGAEEDHMVGAKRWLDAQTERLRGRPVWAINFDGAGNPGRLVLLERFGFGRRFSAPLSAAARRAAKRLDLPLRGVFLPPGHGIDAIPFFHRGIDCLTISSGSLGAATLAIHSAGDTFDKLHGPTLENAARLATEMVRDLAGDEGRSGDGDNTIRDLASRRAPDSPRAL